MNVVKCKNGHFFDGDGYAACPHCGEGIAGSDTAPVVAPVVDKKSPWWKKKETVQQEPEYTPHRPVVPFGPGTTWADTVSESPTDVLPPTRETVLSDENKDDKTIPFWGGTAVSQEEPKAQEAPVAPPKSETIQEPTPEPIQEPVRESISEVTPTSSLKDTIQKASANTEGKTMGYFSKMSSSSGTGNEASVITDPVVGWLVCVAGSHFGESFGISAGKNSIGRGADNNIVLSRDGSVSKSKHAIVIYEPKKRNFYIQPGDSSGLTYLNEDYITETKMIASHDVLEFGDSKFIFIPLCGENFTWEDYMKKE